MPSNLIAIGLSNRSGYLTCRTFCLPPLYLTMEKKVEFNTYSNPPYGTTTSQWPLRLCPLLGTKP